VSSPPGRTWRIRDQRTFTALRTEGRRARRGPVTVTYLADDSGTPPRVAYAVGRKAGGAVVRNRARRRLRAGVLEHHRGPQGPLPAGAYLVSAGHAAATCPWSELQQGLGRALHDATTPKGTS
jgi:ribonuclease P protein component